MKDLGLNLPQRPAKPREEGLTMVMDSGYSISELEALFEVAYDYVDYIKLGWGTSFVTQNFEKKVQFFHDKKMPFCLGGTFFELMYQKKKIDAFTDIVKSNQIPLVEISNGTVTMSKEEKLDFIRQYSEFATVYSEFGSKDTEVEYAPSKWVEWITEELEAGSAKVIAEGRESGKAGLYRDSSEIRSGLVDDIAKYIDIKNIIWEAPQKNQQVWFIKKFGTNVNLGNINIKSVIGVETLRQGLRGDTLLTFNE